MDLGSPSSIGGFMMIFQVINSLLALLIISCSIYGFMLFVKLAKRGIKALDIYIESNKFDENN